MERTQRTLPKSAPTKRSSVWPLVGMVAAVVAVGTGMILYSHFFPTDNLADLDNPGTPKLNPKRPPGKAPPGMVWVPGGEFYMGIDERVIADPKAPVDAYADARTVHKVRVDGFWMDATEVTNAQFAEFVKATGYVTVAEQKPDPKQFPGVPAADLVPFSLCFKKPAEKVKDVWLAHAHNLWWDVRRGASWRHPEGPGSDIAGKDDYPAVHVCWDDAVAYCKWAGKRLPTEAEWEFAARGGLDRTEFAWGKDLLVDGKWMCNAWQGNFPEENLKEDGFDGIAPVKQYPPNGYGLYDTMGNVWEWCADWYHDEYYRKSSRENPLGPASSFDANDPNEPKRVQRGGSYLCADNYCRRYVPGARGKGEPSTGSAHLGFRCVKDVESRPAFEYRK